MSFPSSPAALPAQELPVSKSEIAVRKSEIQAKQRAEALRAKEKERAALKAAADAAAGDPLDCSLVQVGKFRPPRQQIKGCGDPSTTAHRVLTDVTSNEMMVLGRVAGEFDSLQATSLRDASVIKDTEYTEPRFHRQNQDVTSPRLTRQAHKKISHTLKGHMYADVRTPSCASEPKPGDGAFTIESWWISQEAAKKRAKGSNDTATMKRRAEVLALIEESRQYDSTGASAAAIEAARYVVSTLSCKSSKRRGNSRSQSQQDDLGDLPSRGGVGTADSGDWKEVRIKMPPRPHTQQGYRGGEIGARDINKFNCRPLHQQWQQWHLQKQHEQQQQPPTKPVYVCTNIRNEELSNRPPPPPPPPPQQLQQEQQKKQELHRGSNRPATKVERREAKEAGHGAGKGTQRAQTIRVTIDGLTGVHMPIPRSETWGGAHPPGAFLAPRTRDASGSHQPKDQLKESIDCLDILASSHLALSTNVSIAQKDPKSENPGGGRREAENVGSSTQPMQPVLWNTKTCQQRGGYVPLTKGGDGLLPVDKFIQEQKERSMAGQTRITTPSYTLTGDVWGPSKPPSVWSHVDAPLAQRAGKVVRACAERKEGAEAVQKGGSMPVQQTAKGGETAASMGVKAGDGGAGKYVPHFRLSRPKTASVPVRDGWVGPRYAAITVFPEKHKNKAKTDCQRMCIDMGQARHLYTTTHISSATVQCGYPHSVLCSTDPLPECEASIYDQWQDTSWADAKRHFIRRSDVRSPKMNRARFAPKTDAVNPPPPELAFPGTHSIDTATASPTSWVRKGLQDVQTRNANYWAKTNPSHVDRHSGQPAASLPYNSSGGFWVHQAKVEQGGEAGSGGAAHRGAVNMGGQKFLAVGDCAMNNVGLDNWPSDVIHSDTIRQPRKKLLFRAFSPMAGAHGALIAREARDSVASILSDPVRDLTTPAQLHLEAKRTHKSLPIALDPNSNNLTITEKHLEKTRKYLASLDNKTESADSADSADSNQRHKYMQTQAAKAAAAPNGWPLSHINNKWTNDDITYMKQMLLPERRAPPPIVPPSVVRKQAQADLDNLS